MNQAVTILQSLRKLVQLEAELRKVTADTTEHQEIQAKIDSLRAPLPTSILSHYDGRKARGKLSVAPVRNGVCGACHLELPRGRVADLISKPTELNICDNCGVFIYPDDEELANRCGSASKPIPAQRTVKAKRAGAPRRQPVA
jgi:predicted  nucleic acid-binding Zn-ribbon protein